MVPQQVVLRTEAGFEVFVVADEDGRPVARRRAVTVGASAENRVVITGAMNRLLAFGGRYAPRRITLPVTDLLMSD